MCIRDSIISRRDSENNGFLAGVSLPPFLLGRPSRFPRAQNPLSLPFQTPATQANYIVDPFFVSSCDTSKDPVYLVPRSHSVLRWKVSSLAVGDLGTRLETRLDFRHLLGLPREAWQEETVRVRSAGTFPEQRLVIESSMKLNSDFSLHSFIFRTDPSFL